MSRSESDRLLAAVRRRKAIISDLVAECWRQQESCMAVQVDAQARSEMVRAQAAAYRLLRSSRLDRRTLVLTAALILAEIERLDRGAAREAEGGAL